MNENDTDTLETITAAMERMCSRDAEILTRLQIWSAGMDRSKTCERHQTINFIDWERSTWESRKTGQNAIVYKTCVECQIEEARAMRSRNIPEKKRRRRRSRRK